MRGFLVLAIALLCGSAAYAQTSSAAGNATQFEGVTLGEPMTSVRERLGDPVTVTSSMGKLIWRYMERGGAIFLDVLVQDNVAYSVTVVRRFPNSPYTDAQGIAFGMTSDDVRAKRGAPDRVSTNADDGSLDLWYRDSSSVWIYEFYSSKLGFIQVLPPHGLNQGFAAAAATAAADGTSINQAIKIRPSNLLADTTWINTYLAMNHCGNGGRWKETSSTMKADPAVNDLFAYSIVHARCTDGSTERDFFFDTHGALAASKYPIEVDIYQVKSAGQQPSPSPSPIPPH